MSRIDLDALEKLADEGITLAAGRYTEKGVYRHATIKALIAELKEARTMAHTINRVLSPQADRTFDLLISQSQWAVDTCRAFLARNGKADLQKMQNNTSRNAPRGLSDEC